MEMTLVNTRIVFLDSVMMLLICEWEKNIMLEKVSLLIDMNVDEFLVYYNPQLYTG